MPLESVTPTKHNLKQIVAGHDRGAQIYWPREHLNTSMVGFHDEPGIIRVTECPLDARACTLRNVDEYASMSV